ncbi:hypothetical protein J1TS1_27330 [Shouchella clausii]|uniref:Apea-like HEPN domain-containing protein n=1 Tax=Shouchella rhizosphaerae TaxID=866786 RepID=A0ABZ2CYH4_9BACI|nr:hypothetical protein [Shouchella clausii]PAF08322.1 hypothetical protein CHH65_16480 [Shouchella clausii]GIN08588.1 hypothetical protein J1TS1_27330 [Shouchella clausii]
MAKWKLYWVESDGYEDCFVVAKNSRSARSVEANMNGFHISDTKATRIIDIPDEYEEKADQKFRKWSKVHAPEQATNHDLHQWPWYSDKWLLEELGAQFRILEEEEQTLLRDVVYARKVNGECYTYNIGAKAIAEKNEWLPHYNNYDEEPRIDITEQLFTAIGMALVQCQEIEYLFSKSFIFAISEKQQKKYKTFNDFFKGWEKKTLGGLIYAMQEAFEIDTEIKNALTLFLDMRNQLVHGVTITPRYDINTDWGQRELVAFLDLFLSLCSPIKDIAASCFEISIEIGNRYLLEESDEKVPLKNSDELLGLFINCFKLEESEVGEIER